MEEFLITGDTPDGMNNWVEEHDKVCKYSYMGNMSGRFTHEKIRKTAENTCVIRITCLCGVIKEVTIKCWC